MKKVTSYLIFSVIALFFLLCPVYSLFVKGIFHWHVTQPALWRDAGELLVYLAVMLLLAAIAKKKKGIVVLALGSVYLLSVGTLLQCAVSYIYLETILFIGRSFLALFSGIKTKKSAGVCFLTGSLAWGAAAIIMSLLGLGTIEHLRGLTVVFFLLAIANPAVKRFCLDDILLVKYVRCLNRSSFSEFGLHLFFLLVMLISCARVNSHIEFDSNWYALYPDKSLFGEQSFYDFLGYTEFVFYYPKFKELLMAPISGLGLPGYLISVNLWIMVLCMTETYDYLVENTFRSRSQILSTVYLIFSSVCIIGISTTAKSDAISYLYILMLVLYFARCVQTGEQFCLWIALSAGIMSYTVKYTSYLYTTVIFVLIFGMVLYWWRAGKLRTEKVSWYGILLLALACFVFLGTLYRTYRLTGYPTYREGVELWDAMGFRANPYFKVEAGSKPGNVFRPDRLLSVLFDVDNAEKIRAQWTGNYTLFLGLCTFFLFKKKERNKNGFLGVTAAVLVVLSAYFLVTMAEPDGNYFSIAIMTATCYFMIRLTESKFWGFYRRWLNMILVMFMLLNLTFVFITHPSWVTATRFTEEPISFYVSEEKKYEDKENEIKDMGLYEINERLKETGGKQLLLTDGIPCILDARIESADIVFNRYASGANIDDYQEFQQYIQYVGVDGFIVAEDGSGMAEFDDYVNRYVQEYGCLEELNEGQYVYYRIR